MNKSLKEDIKVIAKKFLEKTSNEEIQIISHFDTDGITSASIMIQTLKKLDIRFSLKILKSLEEKFIPSLPKDKIILFLDLASGSLNHLKNAGLKEVFIIDHHEVVEKVPEGINIINPWFNEKEKLSGSGLVYLFCNELDQNNTHLGKLALLGMIGDIMESPLENLGDSLKLNKDIKKIKGLLIYPYTRPLNKVLEYNSQPYIPSVTGNPSGVVELLRECGIEPLKGKYKSLIELTEDEMKRLTTSIILRSPRSKNKEMIGDIFLLKFFNKLEDARELSAMINACSRLGRSDIALKFCLEIPGSRKEAEEIHAEYKQHLISGLNLVSKIEKVEGKGFVIINVRDQIKDTIIGTIASILQNSFGYEEGTIIATMAYYEDKIKVSARNVGRSGRNVRKILNQVIKDIGEGESGGHEFAAGCIVKQKKEKELIENLKKNLEIEMVKI
ncbi:DHH family phosphoesterase [Patescibacteria group bacterium]|nr:DHH family phosphoesterase [Patescibacteria group bacterium]